MIMSKQDLIKEINVSLRRLGLYFSEECKEFLWDLNEEQLCLILKFVGRLSRFYSRRGK